MTRLYDQLGKLNVQHNITKQKRTRKGKARSQFDIVYGIIAKKYVECKYHGNGANVTFDDVSTFAAKLQLNNLSPRQGVMVTNTDYETRAKVYAHNTGIRLIDRQELIKLDWKRKHQLATLVKGPTKGFAGSLERRIMRYEA
ncbi:restriction endonuclease [Candidatus Woesearchaeota archaeon]|nr:restriction endonuclease [Candidatus Woesearchaeota archaeon]